MLALLLAALLVCASLPAAAESDADLSFDLASEESSEAPGVQAQIAGADAFAPADDADFAFFDDDAGAEDAADAAAGDDFFAQDEAEAADGAAQDETAADADANDADAEATDAGAEAAAEDETAGTGIFSDVTAPTYPAEITITAVGDCTLGGAHRNKTDKKFSQAVKKKGYDYFFSNWRSIFEKDDLTIVNLEGPLTTSKDRRKGQYYAFKGSPDYVQILSGSSVEIANVANNHAMDYGAKGLKQTQEVLEQAGIGVSGFDYAYSTTVKGVRVTSLGFTKWDHTASDVKKAVTLARRDCDILIVSIHWGWEKKFKPDKQQRKMGYAAIDAGADLVIGTHTHVYGALEKYKGKYIVYSLGNFCFGGNPFGKDKRCLVFQQTLRYSPTEGVSDAGINIIPAYYSSSAKKNDYQPKPMGGKAGAKLLKAVAKISRGMSAADTLWMPDNYLVWSGIMTQEQLDAANAAVTGALTPTDRAAADALFQEDEAETQVELGSPDLDDAGGFGFEEPAQNENTVG